MIWNGFGTGQVPLTATVKMQWLREDCLFIAVSDIARFVSPTKSKLKASSSGMGQIYFEIVELG